MKSLFENHVGVVGRVLDMQLQRQNVVAGNMANLKTPGYKALKLDFEEELQSALALDKKGKMSTTSQGHMPHTFSPEGFGPEWERAVRPRVVHGEDRVNLDKEMATMAKTNLHYTALTSVIRSNFDGIRSVIQEAGKV